MHFTAACHCGYCWILTHLLWDGYSYGLVNLDIALSRKEPRLKAESMCGFLLMEGSIDKSIPAHISFLFNPLEPKDFFWVGGGPVGFPVHRLQAGVESLARRFWSRKFYERRVHHTAWVGRRLGMAKVCGAGRRTRWHSRGGNFKEKWLEVSFLVPMAFGALCLHIANVRQFHLFCQPGSQVWKRHGDMPLLDGSNFLAVLFLMISTWLKSCQIQPSIHQRCIQVHSHKNHVCRCPFWRKIAWAT